MRVFLPFLLVGAVTACHPKPAASPPSDPLEGQVAGEPPPGVGLGECAAEATHTVPIAMRPRSDEIFGQLERGAGVKIVARSIEGWLGFDPGVAQAANVGPFRLRWIDPTTVSLHGDCARVEKVWAPPPHQCFTMPQYDVAVRAAPSEGASAVAVMHPGEFAAMVSRSANGWYRVELGQGNTGSSAAGYITESDVNANGSDCPKLQVR